MELHSIQPYPQSRAGSTAKHSFLCEDPAPAPSSPLPSRPTSVKALSLTDSYGEKPARKQRRFKSSRLIGEYEKPWLSQKDSRTKLDSVFFWGFALVGCGIGAYICYGGWTSVGDQQYCLQFEDTFQNGIDPNNWNFEVQTDGFGTGSFKWTTTDPRNAYADSAGLHIVPTFTKDDTDITDSQIINGYTLNLTTDGTCTSPNWWECSVTSNSTAGTIINPVRSAHLTTQGKQTLTYGKIEVVAKLPRGDWLWPAIWMMPEDSVYGAWPQSGEIDIMESRGNDGLIYRGGRNAVGSTLHWGPNKQLDQFAKTSNSKYIRRRDFSDGFHTFGVEWSSNYIFTYLDSVLNQVLYVSFGKKMGDLYSRGNFGNMNYQGEGPPANPWAQSSNYNAPFDVPFYLILNVAVGGTTGYFPDGYGGKPWDDKGNNSAAQFWQSKNAWEPTWGPGDTNGMAVQSVKMWKVC